ncbi:VIR protein [Plasmodium vivax]|uniref:VIR protein n=1 Tax=Plasmodium vivax TaxID=5855 RepID=A0A1G4H7U5_PLAVI|nr:VIR protein [Plasmodium vivax]SCA81832.1 VIR protein [Plasmodium vivax]SCO70952.1 VIR protein [Plasmodium vivax]
MSFQCSSLINREDGKVVLKFYSNVFDPRCGTYIFTPFRPSFDNVEEKYLNIIKKINDPTLKYVSIYLVQYYKDGYKYFGNSDRTHKNEACTYFIQWLQEKKELFTYGGYCEKKEELWNKEIEALWNTLISDYQKKSKDTNAWCRDLQKTFKTELPSNVNSPKCEESISHESKSTELSPLPVQTECNCQNVDPVISLQPDQAAEKDPTKNIAVTSGFTAAGTLGTLFFLYRFTPMMSWFRRPGMNNVGTDLYMNPGGAESFLSMQQDNGSNNIFYQPSV